jgi:trehalose-phosphatase
MAQVLAEAQEKVAGLGIDGLIVEDKTVMLGLHFRAAEDVEKARVMLDGIAGELAARYDLLRAGGRLAFELRPPIEFSKKQVVLDRAREEELDAVMFLGDDRVDLPGFDALDELASGDVVTVRVGVTSAEAPPELIERADILLEGPKEVVGFLQRLL